jgi:hypothetical protein
MKSKLMLVSMILACAGCSLSSHNERVSGRGDAVEPMPAAWRSIHEMPVDTILVEQACGSMAGCRTTAHGLSV